VIVPWGAANAIGVSNKDRVALATKANEFNMIPASSN